MNAPSKSNIYGRGLTVVLLQIIPQLPESFTITSLTNQVLKHTNTSTTDTHALNQLRRRIKTQMEYLIADGNVKSKVIEQEGQTPAYITQYEKI
jgi:hypothetical protein